MISKLAYVQHVPGHKNSKGEAASWVVKSHETGQILSSHKSEAEARAHLKQMEQHKHMQVGLTFLELRKQADLDVGKALPEIQDKTTEQINRDTAYTWGSRAIACFQLAKEAKTEEERDALVARALDFRHEALEHASLVEDGGKLVGELQEATKAPTISKKEANTTPYNGNKPQDEQADPVEKEDTGYGGDRNGLFVEPKAGVAQGQIAPQVLEDMRMWLKELTWANMEEADFNRLTPVQITRAIQNYYAGGVSQFIKDGTSMDMGQATANQDLGVIKQGQKVVITGSKGDKVFFYAHRDPTLVGIAHKSVFSFVSNDKALGFLKCHTALSKSASFLQKMSEDLKGLADSSVLEQLESIKQNISNNKTRVVNQLPVSPVLNARLRLNDAAQYFSMRGVVPTERDTISYIQASMAAHTGLPEHTWPEDLVREAMQTKGAQVAVDWADKLLLMQQWHLAGTISSAIWSELMELLDSNDLNEIRVGMDRLFEKASETVKKPGSEHLSELKTAVELPPKPTDIPPAGLKYEPVYESGKDPVWALVAISSKKVPNTLKG